MWGLSVGKSAKQITFYLLWRGFTLVWRYSPIRDSGRFYESSNVVNPFAIGIPICSQMLRRKDGDLSAHLKYHQKKFQCTNGRETRNIVRTLKILLLCGWRTLFSTESDFTIIHIIFEHSCSNTRTKKYLIEFESHS